MASESAELNLTTHRAPASVWDRRGWSGRGHEPALARWLVGIGGGVLAIEGFRRRTFVGSLLAGFGASLTGWALVGPDQILIARHRLAGYFGAGLSQLDRVVDESADSFPASDAPSWTPTIGTGVRARRLAH